MKITYEGEVAGFNTKALTASALAGLLRPALSQVNVVSAPAIAKERGIVIEEATRAAESDYESLMTLTVTTDSQERALAGTVFTDGKPRIVQIKDIKVDAEFAPAMLYVTNEDKPGFIGRFATTLGDAGVNIATFRARPRRTWRVGHRVGRGRRRGPGGGLERIEGLPGVKAAKALRF